MKHPGAKRCKRLRSDEIRPPGQPAAGTAGSNAGLTAHSACHPALCPSGVWSIRGRITATDCARPRETSRSRDRAGHQSWADTQCGPGRLGGLPLQTRRRAVLAAVRASCQAAASPAAPAPMTATSISPEPGTSGTCMLAPARALHLHRQGQDTGDKRSVSRVGNRPTATPAKIGGRSDHASCGRSMNLHGERRVGPSLRSR